MLVLQLESPAKRHNVFHGSLSSVQRLLPAEGAVLDALTATADDGRVARLKAMFAVAASTHSAASVGGLLPQDRVVQTGTLNKGNIRQWMVEAHGGAPSDEQLATTMREMDTNSDGVVSFREFCDYLEDAINAESTESLCDVLDGKVGNVLLKLEQQAVTPQSVRGVQVSPADQLHVSQLRAGFSPSAAQGQASGPARARQPPTGQWTPRDGISTVTMPEFSLDQSRTRTVVRSYC